MNREEAKVAAEVMLAYANGATAQQRRLGDMEAKWYTPSRPVWNWDQFEYRVKPEPREFWVNPNKGIAMLIPQGGARRPGVNGVIRVREVLDDE
jgi:hypothetical protein